MKPIVRAENLSKQYLVGTREASYDTLRDSVVEAVRTSISRIRGNGQRNSETIWALKDVSFEVAPGEVLGVIGRNGAGKSTLLKVLSRITEPTKGRAELYGRVASLLEVGTGFHPELTGKENVYLNGAILGMSRAEIGRKFDEIVAFAELEKFLHTPVKRYSSGMYMRLAFSVASHLEPEILIVDEVLAVGDAAFQKKCLGRIGKVAHEGRTVLFVSHNMTAIQSLCNRVLWVDRGSIEDEGPPKGVVARYLKTTLATIVQRTWDDPKTAVGNEKVRIHRAGIRQVDSTTTSDSITVLTPFVIEFEYWNLVPGARLNLSLVVYNDEGIAIFNTGPADEPDWHGKPFPEGLFRSECFVPGNLMNDGTYRVHLYVVQDQSVVIFDSEDILVFDVSEAPESRSVWYGKWIGAVRPALEWRTKQLDVEPHS